MAEALIEPERIKAIQESICGFLLDEVINPKWRISCGSKDKCGSTGSEQKH